MVNDPVQIIKDEEEKARQKVENLAEENQTRLEDYSREKEKEIESYKEDLRQKGQSELEKAKQEAMKVFKDITETGERDKNALISKANSAQDAAVKELTASFKDHIKAA